MTPHRFSHRLLFFWPLRLQAYGNLYSYKNIFGNYFSFSAGEHSDLKDELTTLIERLNQANGFSFDQTSLYLDESSAQDWLEVEKQADYQAAQNDIPIAEVSDLVRHLYKEFYPTDELDLIALGPGGGEKEVRLAQQLAPHFKKLRFFMIDVSQPLLTFAYKNAVSALSEFSNRVEIFAIMANMHHLQRFLHMLSPPKQNRHRLIAMMGYTFGNLENELLFVRNSLCGLDNNDLFFLDACLAAAPANQPDEIQRKDPRLSHTQKLPSGWNNSVDKWLAGPILRYTRGIREIQFFEVLDSATCCVPGSYVIEKRIRLKFDNLSTKEFTVQRFKRYDANQLITRMKKENWGPCGGWHFGKAPERLGYVFKRLAPVLE